MAPGASGRWPDLRAVTSVASVLVDGLRLPVRVAGDPALDFCNTRAGWGRVDPKEYLTGYPQLVGWVRWSGLVPTGAASAAIAAGQADPAGAAGVLGRALTVRDALYTVLVGAAAEGGGGAGTAGAAWDLIGAVSQAAAGAHRLVPAGASADPAPPAEWVPEPNLDPLMVPYLAVVRAVTRLLTTPAAAWVRACPMPDCGWLFADSSGRRRWCSMALCGNRNKARRHAARARAAPRS